MLRRTQEGYSPFKDDKPKDAKNSPFEVSSVLVVKAEAIKIVYMFISDRQGFNRQVYKINIYRRVFFYSIL